MVFLLGKSVVNTSSSRRRSFNIRNQNSLSIVVVLIDGLTP